MDQPAPVPAVALTVPQIGDYPKLKDGSINRSAAIRECVRLHPEWNYEQIREYVKDRTGKVVGDNTIYRAKEKTLQDVPQLKRRASIKMKQEREVTLDVLRDAMSRAVTANDIYKITCKLIDLAVHGDKGAIDMLFSRLWGKPKEQVNIEKRTTEISLSNLTDEELAHMEALMLKANPGLPAPKVKRLPEPEDNAQCPEEATPFTIMEEC